MYPGPWITVVSRILAVLIAAAERRRVPERGGALVAAVFLVVGRRIWPRPGAPVRAFLATLALTSFVGAVDVMTNANYMFLREKPAAGSLLNFMGPWPWYIGSAVLLAIVFLAVLYAPFWLARRAQGSGLPASAAAGP